jgi:4-hydroxy-tetrahydrodipicolinate reductase
MKHIILSGCCGHMGHAVTATVAERQDCDIIAGLDACEGKLDYPVYSDPAKFSGDADVIIDFSNPAFFPAILDFALARKLPAVIATTGLSAEQIDALHLASETIPVFFSANMSLGINLMLELSKKAAAVLGNSFDIEIVEMHHNRKVDAPSGTALMIADAVSSALPEEPQYVYDRHSVRRKRSKNEIGIHSLRGGTVVGEHEIVFAGDNEVLKISHSAMSRQIFANGAVNAAMYLCGKEPGFYGMSDLIS